MRRGFTLLEVMVALAIAIPALLLLYRQGAVALDLTGGSLATQEALSRAQSRLAALAAGGVAAGDGEGDDGGGYHWQVRAAPSAREAPGRSGGGATLYDVRVQVSWQGTRGKQVVTLETRLLGPATAEN